MIKPERGFVLVCVVTLLMGCSSVFSTGAAPSLKTPPAESKGAGHLAYIGADGNVYITNADRTSIVAVTNNATAPFEGLGLSYQRISWSQDGQLAYAAVTRSGEETSSKLFSQ